MPPDKGVVIIRLDKGAVLNLMMDKKMFLSRPIRPENKTPLLFRPDETSGREQVGREKIDGRAVVKEKLQMRNNGGHWESVYFWTAPDLDWPVRAEAADGSWKLYFTKIKTGRQTPSLFEVPPGFGMIARQPNKK